MCFYKGSSSAGARGSKRPYSAVIQSKPQGAVYGARREWSLERETYSTVRVTADSLPKSPTVIMGPQDEIFLRVTPLICPRGVQQVFLTCCRKVILLAVFNRINSLRGCCLRLMLQGSSRIYQMILFLG